MPNSTSPEDLDATLNAVAARLVDQAGPFGLNITVKVWSWVDDRGEPQVSVKAIPFDQLYVTDEPRQSWPFSVQASTQP
jgi:hypothetical protein